MPAKNSRLTAPLGVSHAPENALDFLSFDADSPKTKAKDWDGAILARSRGEMRAKLAQRRGRGPQKAPTKVQLSLRLAPEVVAYFKATGPGWHTRMAEVLAAQIR